MGANVTSATSKEEAKEVKDKTKRRRGGGRRGRGGVAPLFCVIKSSKVRGKVLNLQKFTNFCVILSSTG